jgi:hypothetical protein
MNENMLVSIDDENLDDVNGGLGFGLSFNDKTVFGASLTGGDGTLSGSLTLFGKTISGSLGLKITL